MCCVRALTGSRAECQQEDGEVSADRGQAAEHIVGGFLWEAGAGLVVLEQGEKVVVAVGGEVGGVEV